MKNVESLIAECESAQRAFREKMTVATYDRLDAAATAVWAAELESRLWRVTTELLSARRRLLLAQIDIKGTIQHAGRELGLGDKAGGRDVRETLAWRESAPDSPDTPKKVSGQELPQNPDVLELCRELKKRYPKEKQIAIAKDFCKGTKLDPKSLLRQAGRFKSLWKPDS